MITDFLRSLYQQHPSLLWTAGLNAGLLVVSLLGLFVDSRQVTGVNPWIKPLKFEVSVIVFLLTAGWILMQLPAFQTGKRIVAGGIALSMAVEILLVVLQAARGVPSHFNFSTPLDSIVFGVMGAFIALNTVLSVVLLILCFLVRPELPPAMVWGVRLGLIVFLLASWQGTLLVKNRAHTVGAPDGGPGLPFVNWSKQHGDLRVAHFVGMHAIQLLPALGWLLSRNDRNAGTFVVVVAFVLFLWVFSSTLHQAMAGRPVLRL